MSYCTSFQDLVPGMLAEGFGLVRSGQSTGISYR
jgi:hypothetical protein